MILLSREGAVVFCKTSEPESESTGKPPSTAGADHRPSYCAIGHSFRPGFGAVRRGCAGRLLRRLLQAPALRIARRPSPRRPARRRFRPLPRMTQFAKETLPISLEEEMRRSYLDYAMSVIVGRALPDARDGLKPVHRRVLFAMHELNNDWNRPYKKSARIVGDVIGKYHPHGDQSVYDTIVRMAQDFSHAPHAGRRPGQLRLGRRRQRRGDALHRDPPVEDRARDARRHRQGDGRLRPELRRLREGAAGAADAAAQPAGQRLGRHRGRHGDQHPAAQPERGRRRLPAPAEEPGRDDRRADGDHPGARLPDRRDHLRPGRRARGLPHRPRQAS